MKTNLMLSGAMVLTMVGTGCATKKYVAQTMAPVEARVATAETKNADQDKALTAQGEELTQLQTSLSRTNERVTDVTAAAQRASDAAGGAQRTADGAVTAAAGALTAANTGRDQAIARANEVERALSQKVDATMTLKMAGSETILFGLNQATLTDEAKSSLDTFAQGMSGKQRYIIEVEGFTDKTGSIDTNTALSQKRAEVVARYLITEHDIPLHMVTMMGSGYTDPVADDTTRDGRKQNRRVEVRLFAPEIVSLTAQN
jgi:outer membrane protein OmpA-like peptidoglycan-associated protein